MFIVLEGGDKTGKSSISNVLVEYIDKTLKLKVKKYSFPGLFYFFLIISNQFAVNHLLGNN
jgi:thymidylate kinase